MKKHRYQDASQRNSALFCGLDCYRTFIKAIPNVTCLNCGKIFHKTKGQIGQKNFCSHSCCATFSNLRRDYSSVWTPERKLRQSTLMKDSSYRPVPPKKEKDKRVCPKCKKVFEVIPSSSKKYCGNGCFLNSGAIGGFRANSTIRHQSIYKDQKMDSGSELKFAQLLDKNSINWTKNSKIFFNFHYEGKPKKYYPDFFLPDYQLWVEIKGKRYIEAWLPNKLNSVFENGQRIILFDSKFLKKEAEVLSAIQDSSNITHPVSYPREF
jgi:hypothetical protein